MLAKNLNDDACGLNQRGAGEFFASKLAPTKSLARPGFFALQEAGAASLQLIDMPIGDPQSGRQGLRPPQPDRPTLDIHQ